MKGHSIHQKILRAILTTSLLFGIAVSLAAVFQSLMQRHNINRVNDEYADVLIRESSDSLTELNRQVAENLTDIYVSIVNENFKDVRLTAESLASYMGTLYDRTSEPEVFRDYQVGFMKGALWETQKDEFSRVKEIRDYIRTLAAYDPDNQDVLDVYVVTDSGMCLDGTGKEYDNIGEYTELRDTEWYTGAKETGKAYWARAFTGAATGLRKITCGVPFYDGNGTFRGVAAIDLSAAHIYDTALATRSEQVEHAVLLDKDGSVMVNPDRIDMEMFKDSVFIKDGGFLSVGKIPETDWRLCLVFQFDLVDRATEKIDAVIDENSRAVGTFMSRTITRSIVSFCLIMLAGCVLVFGLSRKLAQSLVRPISRLIEEVAVVGTGNLDHPVTDMDTGDEIGMLAEAFNRMMSQLKEYIENLAAVTAEKERIAADLNVATKIQASMLPSIFPAFPERTEFSVYAVMSPAKEVGGDFYDFFLVDEDHLALVIADVSGKGVPAALFMVITKTLIKNCTQTGSSPAAVLETVNNQLCENNDAEMFVTVWLGILEISSGRLTCANAGHEYPAVYKDGGSFELLRDPHGFVLAGFSGMKYKEYELTLAKGDRLFVYTDGVPEAVNVQNQAYGTGRMLGALNTDRGREPEELLEQVKQDMERFVGTASQFDDVTMLVLEVKGGEGVF